MFACALLIVSFMSFIFKHFFMSVVFTFAALIAGAISGEFGRK